MLLLRRIVAIGRALRLTPVFAPLFTPLIDALIGPRARALVKTLTRPLLIRPWPAARVASGPLSWIKARIRPWPALIPHRGARGVTTGALLVEAGLPLGALFLHGVQRLTRARHALAAHGRAPVFAGP